MTTRTGTSATTGLALGVLIAALLGGGCSVDFGDAPPADAGAAADTATDIATDLAAAPDAPTLGGGPDAGADTAAPPDVAPDVAADAADLADARAEDVPPDVPPDPCDPPPAEIADGLDNDCDGETDEGVVTVVVADDFETGPGAGLWAALGPAVPGTTEADGGGRALRLDGDAACFAGVSSAAAADLSEGFRLTLRARVAAGGSLRVALVAADGEGPAPCEDGAGADAGRVVLDLAGADGALVPAGFNYVTDGPVATVAADTWHTLAIERDEAGAVRYTVDDIPRYDTPVPVPLCGPVRLAILGRETAVDDVRLASLPLLRCGGLACPHVPGFREVCDAADRCAYEPLAAHCAATDLERRCEPAADWQALGAGGWGVTLPAAETSRLLGGVQLEARGLDCAPDAPCRLLVYEEGDGGGHTLVGEGAHDEPLEGVSALLLDAPTLLAPGRRHVLALETVDEAWELRASPACGAATPVTVAGGAVTAAPDAPLAWHALVRPACEDARQCCGPTACPDLPGYDVSCNVRDRCAYAPSFPAGWRAAERWIWLPPAVVRRGGPDEPAALAVIDEGFLVAANELTTYAHESCEVAGICDPPSAAEESAPARNRAVDGRGAHPQDGLAFAAAERACRWIGGRLPSEAEWVYAARGPAPRGWPWGDTAPSCGDGSAHFGGAGCGLAGTAPVGGREDGAAWSGARDMAGNVAEWVADCWHDDLAAAPGDAAPWTEACDGDGGVVRGGGWSSAADAIGAAARESVPYDEARPDIGARCVRTRTSFEAGCGQIVARGQVDMVGIYVADDGAEYLGGTGLATDGEFVYQGNHATDAYYRLDGETGAWTGETWDFCPGAADSVGMTWDGALLWGTFGDCQCVTAWAPGTADCVATFDAPGEIVGGIAWDAQRERLWVAERRAADGDGRIHRVTTDGAIEASFAVPWMPAALEVAASDELWITTGPPGLGRYRLERWTTDGAPRCVHPFPAGLDQAFGLTRYEDDLWVTDQRSRLLWLFAPIPPGLAPPVVDEHTIALWRFAGDGAAADAHPDGDVAEAVAADAGPYGFHAALENGAAPVRQGRFGGALALGRAQRQGARLPDDPAWDGLTAFTMEAWVRLTTLPDAINRFTIFDRHHGYENDAWEWYVDGDSRAVFILQASSNETWAQVESDVRLQAGRWHHVAVAWDGSRLRLLVDGVLEDEAVTPFSALADLDYGPTIGFYDTTPNSASDGRIDELHISDIARY